MTNVKWPNIFIIVALAMAALGLIMPQQAEAPAVVAPQAFQCAAGTMCVQNGGKSVTMQSGSAFQVSSGAYITIADGYLYVGSTGPFTVTGPLTISGVISNAYFLTKR